MHNIVEIENLKRMLVDSQRGYAEAAEVAENSAISNAFRERAHERAEMARELQFDTDYDDEAPEGTFTGSAHRLFMNLKSL
ncbi:MAG: DUF2383 domain-containing protein, partial [Sandaracinobacteroides sp.]